MLAMPNGIEAQAVKHLKKCQPVQELLMSAVGVDNTMAIALCQDGRRKRDGKPKPEYNLEDARVADVAHLQKLVGPERRWSSARNP